MLLGSSLSFSFHNVSYLLRVASQVEKNNKQGRSYDSQLQLMYGSNMTAPDATSHSLSSHESVIFLFDESI